MGRSECCENHHFNIQIQRQFHPPCFWGHISERSVFTVGINTTRGGRLRQENEGENCLPLKRCNSSSNQQGEAEHKFSLVHGCILKSLIETWNLSPWINLSQLLTNKEISEDVFSQQLPSNSHYLWRIKMMSDKDDCLALIPMHITDLTTDARSQQDRNY